MYVINIKTRKMIICCIIFTETERRIRANNREYNSQFNYAVRKKVSCITNLSELKVKKHIANLI